MISRRALLLTGAALAGGSALSGCGSSGPAAQPAALPSYAGKGETTTFDGTWIGVGYSTWRLEVKDGVFTGAGEGTGLSSWSGSIAGFIRKDHTLEGSAASNSNGAVVKVGGTWPRIAIHWSDGNPSVIRAERA